uniref:Uncharacterized protein n=1 Tax=Rhizophora mucronata TaxID=61149 RepID=A0A2P2J2F1_RHIMU
MRPGPSRALLLTSRAPASSLCTSRPLQGL